ncbi:NucA/NucB deoxyribonuclease domain-containing protein [Actinomadura chibensis]|nr:hypothetical protein [Actinomadura chibensis]
MAVGVILLCSTAPALAQQQTHPRIVIQQIATTHAPLPNGGKESRTQEQVQREAERTRSAYTAKADDYRNGHVLGYDRITYAECVKNKDSGRPGGWVKNHFAWCGQFGEKWIAQRCNDDGCVPGGYLDLHYVIIGQGHHGPVPGSTTDRYMTFDVKIDYLVNTDLFQTPGTTWGTRMDCLGKDSSKCKPSALASKPLSEWSVKPDASFQITSPAKPPTKNDEQRLYADVKQTSDARIPGAVPEGGPLSGAVTSIRFDSAQYIQKNGNTGTDPLGSIFTKADPFLTYSDDIGTEYVEVADHIKLALDRPGETKPPFSDKQIPGGGWGNPLHRLAASLSDENTKRRDRNRYYSKKACDKYYPGWDIPKDPRDGKSIEQCDEFPFASTLEGAARFLPEYDGPRFENMFSARPVHRDDNGAAGRVLADWYDWDRILHGDPFFVKVE